MDKLAAGGIRDDESSDPSVKEQVDPVQLHRLAREWGFLAREQLLLAKELQTRAAEEGKHAEQLEKQGLLAESLEARDRETKLLEEAETTLRKAQAALKAEGNLEVQEQYSADKADVRIRTHMPELLAACWRLANAVRTSKDLDPQVRQEILQLYEQVGPELALIQDNRNATLLSERLSEFVQATRDILVHDILLVWEQYKDVLFPFL